MDPLVLEFVKTSVGTATKFLLEQILKSKWEKGFSGGKQIIEEMNKDECYTSFLIKHVARTLKIRTIQSPESDVYINDVYHPLKIREANGNEDNILTVKDGFLIEEKSFINIIGIAGQGKSTILRKVFIEQLKHGEKIPFFIELRKAEKIGVKKHLEMILLECGIPASEQSVIELLKSNKVILMLDGFDEINSEHVSRIMDEILNINNQMSTQLITTTRPDTLVCNEPNITNFKVEFLDKEDIIAIINKLNVKNGIDVDLMPALLETLSRNDALVGVMNLPILVNLFYVSYPYLDSVPQSAVDFYSSLFVTLYLRHDKIKNHDREKSSLLSYKEAFDCFNALCFMSLNDGNLDFTELSLSRYVESAMKVNGLLNDKNKPEQLLQDFIKVTCLIQKDGFDRYVFLHKSIQEYHAAEFVKDLGVDKKEFFFRELSNSIASDMKFSNAIKFLMEIERENTIKLMLIPLCEKFDIDKWGSPSDAVVTEIYENISSSLETQLLIVKDEKDVLRIRYNGISLPYRKYSWINTFHTSDIMLSPLDKEVLLPFFKNNHLTFSEHFPLFSAFFNSNPLEEDEPVLSKPLTLGDIAHCLELENDIKESLRATMIDLHQKLYAVNFNKIQSNDDALKGYFDFL
ncbi:NACHT domain-containing protein [Pantoea agglomerans]|uniref:NACHT domain-containing protein n=1 Tax=Enterobacter agglomerans TaxID=549 RepID=UPI003C7A81BC